MENRRYASFLARLLAWSIDIGIYAMPHIAALWWISTHTKLDAMIASTLISLVLIPLNPLMYLGYDVISYYIKGSPGKYLTGLEVAQEHHDAPLSFWRFLFRQTIGYQFSSIIFHLGFWAIFKDEKRRGWHDKAVSSVVVVKRTWWPVGLIVFLAITTINFVVLGLTIHQAIKNPVSKEISALIGSYTAQQAIETTQKAITEQETTEEVYVRPEFKTQLMQANIQIQTKQYPQAKRETATLMSIAKTAVEKGIAHRTRGLLSIYLNDYASAQTDLLTAEKNYPTDPDTLWLLANVYTYYEDFEAAAEYAEDAVYYDDTKAEYYNTLAIAYYNLGMDVQALRAIEKAVSLDPTNEDYQEDLQELRSQTK